MRPYNRFAMVVTLGLILSLTACGLLPAPPPTATPLPPSATPTRIPPTPTATLTPTPVPDGPCDNPFLPMVQGNHWVYEAASEQMVYRVELTVVRVENDRATIQIDDPRSEEGPYQEVIRCRNGDLENFPILFESLLLYPYFRQILDTYYQTGFYVPSFSKLNGQGWDFSWENTLLTEERARADYPEYDVYVEVLENRTMTLSWHSSPGREAVIAPAGSFEHAVRVSHSLKSLVTVFMVSGSTGTPGSILLDSTEWFEPYVGLVKAQVNQLNLVQYDLPLPVDYQMVVELIQFTPGE